MQVPIYKYLPLSYDVRVTSLTLLFKLSKVVFFSMSLILIKCFNKEKRADPCIA